MSDMEDTLEVCLIELVRKNKLLYDLTCEDYKIQPKKDKVWEEIRSELTAMGFSIKDTSVITKKWKALRDRYRRIKNETGAIPASGSGAHTAKKVKWAYYETLKFLDNFTKKQNTEGNLDSNSEILHRPSSCSSPASGLRFQSSYSHAEHESTDVLDITDDGNEIIVSSYLSDHDYGDSDDRHLPLFRGDTPDSEREIHPTPSTSSLRFRRNKANVSATDGVREQLLRSVMSSNEAIAKVMEKDPDVKTKEEVFGDFIGKYLLGMPEEKRGRKMQEIMSTLVAE